MQPPIEILGVPGSPYTRKMIALARYRHIPHRVLWRSQHDLPAGYPEPRVKLLPMVFFRSEEDSELDVATDSTPIARRLESLQPARSCYPKSPELAFYADLIEDYADEWLTRPMFHYRWHFPEDRANAGPLLAYWSDNSLDEQSARDFAEQFTAHQHGRLHVVGSSDSTATFIEESYHRFLEVFDALIGRRGFVLGARPSVADFAIHGQLTQLGVVEPTPRRIMEETAPRVRAWIDLVEDLSGLAPEDGDWFTAEEARSALQPLLRELAQSYVPVMIANARAALATEKHFSVEVGGRTWTQRTFPYQLKCVLALREKHAALPAVDRRAVDETLALGHCGALVDAPIETAPEERGC